MSEAKINGGVLLAVDNVSVSFGGVRPLIEVSFEISEREVLAIIGPNGAGKTSMLNVINGFYHPTHGSITFKGKTRAQMRPPRSKPDAVKSRSVSATMPT